MIGGKIALKLAIPSSTIGGKIVLKLGISSLTIGRSSATGPCLSTTRLRFRSSIRFPIMGFILTPITLMLTLGTIITGGALTDTDPAINPGSQHCRASLLALGIIMVPSMGLWALKRGEQSALSNATTICTDTARSMSSFSQQWVSVDPALQVIGLILM